MDKDNDILTPQDEALDSTAQDASMEQDGELAPVAHSAYKPEAGDAITHHLGGMYQNWFLDYASYVILERAVPDIYDGLKPVQRRILHTMNRMEDGRYNKVANVVGETMKFHPHGNASIKDALVQLGQKDLLVDTQGNWGNILTGDDAAAERYIEARLTKFALETVFSPKVTKWKLSYDGRNKEPITLPIKFPLLLMQGVEGIAVGLNSKILPHNFNELLDASVACLRGEPFALYPDFPTGGSIDVSRYNDGERGGVVKIRAKISKLDNKTLVISEIPYGTTTGKLIESIIRASEKGKIKIRKTDDLTAEKVEIQVHLAAGVSSDKTIDALYAFTDCELSVSPNCCVIHDKKPRFLGVSELLRISTEHTMDLLRREQEIQRAELREQFFFVSLEKIFIENRIYKDKEFEESRSRGSVGSGIERGEAERIALSDAGLDRDDVSGFRIESDRDDGRIKYEIEFRTSEREYDYDIAAEDGMILKASWERRGRIGGDRDARLSEDEATAIARKAFGPEAERLSVWEEWDDGRFWYEAEAQIGSYRYEADITGEGEVVSVSRDYRGF